MKTKTVQYSIQNPCDKSWNDMTPEINGRFCGACEKSVVDFTNMSDFSIVSYLENHKHEKVCGRFTKPQLDRVYILNQPVFAQTFDLRAVVLGLALTTFCAVQSFSQTEAPEPIKRIDTTQFEPMIFGKVMIQHFDHSKDKKVSGTVFNSRNDFRMVAIELKTDDGKVLKAVQPSPNGKFEIDLDWNLKPSLIEISGVGFERQVLYFGSSRTITNVEIHLLDEIEMIRGEIIQGDVKEEHSSEDQILQKMEMGNVSIQKSEE